MNTDTHRAQHTYQVAVISGKEALTKTEGHLRQILATERHLSLAEERAGFADGFSLMVDGRRSKAVPWGSAVVFGRDLDDRVTVTVMTQGEVRRRLGPVAGGTSGPEWTEPPLTMSDIQEVFAAAGMQNVSIDIGGDHGMSPQMKALAAAGAAPVGIPVPDEHFRLRLQCMARDVHRDGQIKDTIAMAEGVIEGIEATLSSIITHGMLRANAMGLKAAATLIGDMAHEVAVDQRPPDGLTPDEMRAWQPTKWTPDQAGVVSWVLEHLNEKIMARIKAASVESSAAGG